MPKDLIHFKIAEQTAHKLTDTQFGACIHQENDALLLGSVMHDALFYAVTPGGLRLEALGHRLHGADGQDTFDFIRLQARHAKAAKDKTLPAAILVGLISHLYADAVIHPLVWHMTGNYYDDNPEAKSATRQRHRALESLMDMVACPEMMGRARYRLRTMLHRCPSLLTDGIPIPEIGDMALLLPDTTQKQLGHAWTIFSSLQWTFSLTGLARTLFAMRRILPRHVIEIAMLYYAPQLLKQAESVSGDIHYLNPLTGRTLSASLEQLMENAATKAASLCRQLEPAIFGEAPVVIPGPGPSLDAGVTKIGTDKLRFFATPSFPNLE